MDPHIFNRGTGWWWSDSRYGRFTAGKILSVPNEEDTVWPPRTGVAFVKDRKLLCVLGIEPNLSVLCPTDQ